MMQPPATRRRRSRRRIGRASARPSPAVIAIFAFLVIRSSVSALAMMLPTRTTHHPLGGPVPTTRRPPPARRSTKITSSYSSSYSSSSSSSTALRFFFDKFLQPYGISSSDGGSGDRTRTNDHENNSDDGELLDALLPRLTTREDRSRTIENFQRARLYEQFRLSRMERNDNARVPEDGKDDGGGGGVEDGADDGNGNGHDYARDSSDVDAHDDNGDENEDDDDDDDSFRRAVNQEGGLLHHENNSDRGSWVPADGMTIGHSRMDGMIRIRNGGNSFDKDEAFQRALLGERLRIGRLQRQRKSFSVGGTHLVEGTTVQCERELHSMEREAPRSMTMVREGEEVEDDVEEDADECCEKTMADDRHATSIGVASYVNDDGHDNGDNAMSSRRLSVNRTEGIAPSVRSMQLDAELEMLHHMVTAMTRRASSSGHSGAIATNNTSSYMQNFLSTTYLPLPPREDASFMSLVLAPVAHLVSSLFLLGAGGFYAAMSIVDLICNDDEAECSTRACLKLTSSVFGNCWGHLFLRVGGGGRNDGVDLIIVVRRMMRALRISAIASYYAVAFILLRSFRHSKYAHESIDAVTGSLRYLVYAIRSTNVMLARAMDAINRSFEFIVRWVGICLTSVRALYHNDEKMAAVDGNSKSLRRNLNPLQMIPNIKSVTKQRLNERSTMEDERKHLRLDELYRKKLRLLNLDRVAFERERKQLQEAKEHLEIEKLKLLAEGVSVLSWYAAAGELAARESREVAEKQSDRKWYFWRGGSDRDKRH